MRFKVKNRDKWSRYIESKKKGYLKICKLVDMRTKKIYFIKVTVEMFVIEKHYPDCLKIS